MKKIKLFTEELINQSAEYLIKANYPIVLSGAGISAESGIPTFRKNDSESTKVSYFGNYKNFIEDPKSILSKILFSLAKSDFNINERDAKDMFNKFGQSWYSNVAEILT